MTTTTRLSIADVQAIEQRWDRATPGPWTVTGFGNSQTGGGHAVCEHEMPKRFSHIGHIPLATPVAQLMEAWYGLRQTGWNSTAIAAAPTDVKNLLRELRLTVAERDTYRIERDEALAREAVLLAEIRAHHEARGLLEDA